MLLSEAKKLLKDNGYRLLKESEGAERMFMNKVLGFLMADLNFSEMFGEDEAKELINKYYDAVMEYMAEGGEAAPAACAAWLTDRAYEDSDLIAQRSKIR